MLSWRLLRDGITDAHHHFAVEEALVRLVDEGESPPTLRLRQVQRAVFLGAMQEAWSEVDVDYCGAHGIKIVRRANGGGAVYHDVGSFCFSAFFPRALFPQSDAELYPLFAVPVSRTCADYGLTATPTGRNDLLVGGRKIYGAAQLAWYTAFVQSGTFLVNMDFEVMAQALTPPALKFADKTARSVKERVTSLERELGHPVPVEEVMARLVRHFTDWLDIELTPGALTPAETALAADLLAVKYGTDEWNLGTRRTYSVTVATRTAAGVMTLAADLDGDLIQAARLHGDLLLSDQGTALTALAQALSGQRLATAPAVVTAAALPPAVKEAVLSLLADLKPGT